MAITPFDEKEEIMSKLIEIFAANPTYENRIKLQQYLSAHPFASCFASTAEHKFLKTNNFKG